MTQLSQSILQYKVSIQTLCHSQELFCVIIDQVVFSSFVCLSLCHHIKTCIAICLELFLFDNIVWYIQEYKSFSLPVLFPLNIQHKHYPQPILAHFTHSWSWRDEYCTMNQKNPFWIRICRDSYCNMIFCEKIHDKCEQCKWWFVLSMR